MDRRRSKDARANGAILDWHGPASAGKSNGTDIRRKDRAARRLQTGLAAQEMAWQAPSGSTSYDLIKTEPGGGRSRTREREKRGMMKGVSAA